MRDRVLVQGNIDLGIICYKGLCYSFTSNMAAQDFISDPEWLVKAFFLFIKCTFSWKTY